MVVKKTQLGQGLFVATRVLGSYEDAARLSQDVATEQTRVKRAQLGQGQYGAPTLGRLRRREAASLRCKWQTGACRSCGLAV